MRPLVCLGQIQWMIIDDIGSSKPLAHRPDSLKIDQFDGAKPRFSRRRGKAPLRVNPEQAPAFMPGSRRVDCTIIHRVGYGGTPLGMERGWKQKEKNDAKIDFG
jgi:hypothetical protein